ncbi:SusC/RagA family TonB-linked outer membrane protein [Fulvivirga ligni]|uniref:SusC/RagA family TonB-linked outer membrane protein n=1 Tax=Fulvivirga ligni TaxID=2904246 RepID=UPI001F278208|nr:TonB-dependent receptor [Fulvivirga ligni]UII23487.1 TonB-dependent receptor [Fulvivirga ligni]
MKNFLLGSFVLILMFSFGESWAQQRTISGKVTSSEDGSALPGVNVVLKGTTNGTVTDIDGNYSLSVSSSDGILTFSFIGLKTEEVEIGSKTVVDVQMADDVQQLSEVVVTGYSKESKAKVAGSIATVDASTIEKVPLATFDQILQGQSPGLVVTAGSGQPGTNAVKVRIRGNGSINGGNDPLYVVDGVPIGSDDIATLNPNDFGSVSILKDASATAIYGSRGANGVIVITTKSGRTDGSARVTYRTQYGTSQLARENFKMMNSTEKIAFEQFVQRGPTAGLDPNDPDDAAELDRLRAINTNWRDAFLRDGKTKNHEISISGGNQNIKYFTSGSYFDQEGTALSSDFERYTLRFNVYANATDKLRFGLNSSLGYSLSNFAPGQGVNLANPFAAAYLANPYEQPYDPETGELVTGNGRTGSNSLERLLKNTDKQNETKVVMSAFAEYEFIPDLTLRSTFGIDYTQEDDEFFVPPNTFGGRNVANGNQGQYSKNFYRDFQYVWTNLLSYSFNINADHDFGVSLGMEAIDNYDEGFGFSGFGINSKLPNSNSGITPGSAEGFIPTLGGYKTSSSLLSYFGILNYTFNQKYNLKLSLRRDGSSRFGDENQFATLWSVGGSWNASSEPFLKDIDFINNLKLRASYGQVGNQVGIGNFQSIGTFGSVSYGAESGLAPTSIGNPNLKWEIQKQANVGIDFGLWQDRISGSLDFYNSITDDLFIDTQLSRTTGFSVIQTNAGQVRNRGIEFSLSAEVLRIGDFSWTIGGNIAHNDNEILDLGQVSEFESGTSIIREGLPIGSHYVVEWAGVNPANGQPLYRDKEGNLTSVFDASNAVAKFGTSEPPTTGGINTKLVWKGFTLTGLMSFAHGYSRFNNQTFFQENPNFAQYNLSTIMNTMWKEPGDVTEVQSYAYGRQFSSKDIEDASFMRLRNVMLSYNLPSTLLSKTKIIRSVRVFVQGQNLATWTKWTGFDPEDDNNIGQYEYPVPKIYTMGLDVTF